MERHHKRADRIIAMGISIALAIAALVTLRLRANLQVIYDDLGYVELPSPTRWAVALPWGAILCLFLVPGVWLLVKDAWVRDARVRWWCGLVVRLAFLAWILLLAYSLFRPLIVSIERLD